MPKTATIYTCTKCDAQHPKWLGQCATCGGWGTLMMAAATTKSSIALPSVRPDDIPILATIDPRGTDRRPTGIEEFDLAVGGGLVPGAVLLLSGEPGIGKSTLLLAIAAAVASQHTGGNRATVLYLTGEETPEQIRARADRLHLDVDGIHLLATSDAGRATAAIRALQPTLAIVDSVQTLALPDLPTDAGGVAQVRTVASLLGATAKELRTAVVLVGHVTKDGSVAGPKTLEHLVDQVAVLEGDPTSDLRILRTTKNRYGPTDVAGVFTMDAHGLVSCNDPAGAFLKAGSTPTVGTTVTAVAYGTRIILAEIQALVSRSSAGPPQRRAIGCDVNRLHVLLAVLAQHGELSLATSDVHVAVSGGIRVDDPAADLAILAALCSAASRTPPSFDAALGEVGLNGNVRAPRAIERRIQELTRLGRRRIVVPEWRGAASEKQMTVAHIRDLVAIFPSRSLR